MLTLEKCRQILGSDAPESEEDLERLRDHLYALARFAVEIMPHRQISKPTKLMPLDEWLKSVAFDIPRHDIILQPALGVIRRSPNPATERKPRCFEQERVFAFDVRNL